ncbi:hypothetical protein CBR_g50924, partial [Chara braunii]
MAPCQNSNRVIAFDCKGEFLVLKIVTKGRNKESEEEMQKASVSVQRPRKHTPIAAVDESAAVEESEEEVQTASVSVKRPRTHTALAVVDESAAVISKTRVMEVMEKEAKKADYGKPECEKRIEEAVANLELKWRKAVNEMRKEHAASLQKLEKELELKRMKAVKELREEHTQRVQTLEGEVRNLKAEIAAMADQRNGESNPEIQNRTCMGGTWQEQERRE